MLPEDLPFRVIRVNSEDEVLARANNLLVGRAAYQTAGERKLGVPRPWYLMPPGKSCVLAGTIS